jgi:hypothetical protein
MTPFGKVFIPLVTIASVAAGIVLWKQPAVAEFDSPKKAVTALVIALRADDMASVKGILGPDGARLLSTADGQPDRAAIQKFIFEYLKGEMLVPRERQWEIIEVGEDEWPFPIPLVKNTVGWHYDGQAGKREILARGIGQDELSTIQSCKAFVDAQREYASVRHGDVSIYARRIASTNDGWDGLYWPNKAGKPSSPLGPDFANAEVSTQAGGGKSKPYHGYYYRILTAQGPSADGGAYGYVAHGKMIGGFGLIAYPAEYRVTGVMTFIVNQDDVVFQKDLGPKTTDVVSGIKSYDPGPGWTKIAERAR